MNKPLHELDKDLLARIDVFNYPDMSYISRNRDNRYFGDTDSKDGVPSLRVFANTPPSKIKLLDVDPYTGFSTLLDSDEDKYFANSVARVIAEDSLFLGNHDNVIDRSVTAKVLPYIENQIGMRVLMLGEAPGELAESLADMYPDTQFIVTSKKPTMEDDLVFLPGLGAKHNVTLQYMNADEAMRVHAKESIDLIISDVGMRDIHKKGVELKFNSIYDSIFTAHARYQSSTPIIVKGYTPTFKFLNQRYVYYVKPEYSGNLNREFYAIKGWVPSKPLSQLQLVEKQLGHLMDVVQDISYKPDAALDNYKDWAISPNGIVPTHDFCTTAQFSTYLRFNLPKDEGELFDPNSDDSRRWLIFTRRAGMYSSSTIDSHDNTVSYAARGS
jgi:hypothetical protein